MSDKTMSNDRAMYFIAMALDEPEWSPDTLDYIARVVELTGRSLTESDTES